mgnify:CR=1 FL=1
MEENDWLSHIFEEIAEDDHLEEALLYGHLKRISRSFDDIGVWMFYIEIVYFLDFIIFFFFMY